MAIKRYKRWERAYDEQGEPITQERIVEYVLASDYDRAIALLRRAAERLELLHEGECEWEPPGKTVPEKACTCGLSELLSAIDKELEGT